MITAAKTIANQASSARRTATSLRSLAAPSDIDPADRGVLLTAARIVEKMASETAKRAKTMAREEARYEAAYHAALPAATAYAESLPRAAIIDQSALIFVGFYQPSYVEKEMDSGATGGELLKIMAIEVDGAVRDIATSLAHKIAKSGGPLATETEKVAARFAAYRDEPRAIRFAARVEAAIAADAKAAA